MTGNVTCTAVSTDNDCTTPEICACGNTVTAAKSHTGGEANCEKLAHCADCGMEYGELDPAKHEKDTFIYEPNADGTTHIKKNECCGATAAADEVHTYGDNDKCVCGAEKPEEVTTTELIDDDTTPSETTPSETTPSVTTPSVTTPPPADEGCAGCSGSGFIGLVMLMAATLGTAIVIGKKK